MPRKAKEPTFKDFFNVLADVIGLIVGTVAKGFFLGLGFWWAFSELIK